MQVQTFKVGQLRTNCYLAVADLTDECVIIDAGADADVISEEIMRQNLELKAILATHGHYDHVLAARELQLAFSVPFLVAKADQFLVEKMQHSAEYWSSRKIIEEAPEINQYLTPETIIKFGQEELKVFPSPGHTPGGVCLYHQQDKKVFTGDSLFADGILGRTDLPYSNPADLKKSVKKIRQKFEDYLAFAGHGQEFRL